MGQGIWRSPAMVVAWIALFVALGGSVYAAKQAKLNGKSVRVKSLPGNRLQLRSVPANRLKPGVLQQTTAAAAPSPLTGADINELTLGQVPNAAHAEEADFAQRAGDAQTAVNAISAIDAQTVNGFGAGCKPGTRLFAGACWQSSPSVAAATAPQAAIECASQGGTLPDALALAAFAKQPGINLHEGDEWANDIVSFTAENAFAVATVSSAGIVKSGLFNGGGASATKRYRCVIPLVA